MKKFLLFLMSLFPLLSMGQTTLQPGEVVILEFHGYGSADNFSFMPLVNLQAGTTIHFTDIGWNSTLGSFNTTLESNPDMVTYTAPSVVTAGTIIKCASTGGSSGFTPYSIDYTRAYFNNLDAIGSNVDQVLVFQGTKESPTFIWAINGGAWVTTGAAAGSAVPQGLTDGSTAMALPAMTGAPNLDETVDDASYKGPTTAATAADWRTRILNNSNWTLYSNSGNSPYDSYVNGTSLIAHSGSYTVTLPALPTVSGISPTSGVTTGGTSVVITGTNFAGVTSVKFGATNATSYTVNSATQITATSPAGSSGTVDVTVTTSGGTSATSSADQFTYLTPGTFTGASNNDWATATNWAGGSVPTSGTDVTIPSGKTAVIGATTTANCNNLTVTGNLTIQSSASGTGSLKINGTSTGNVSCERYMTGNAWHVVSPIASGQNVADFLTANTLIATSGTNRGLMDYKTSTNTWNTYYQTTGATGTMDAGKGYSARITANGTVTFTGTLTSGNTTVSLSNTGEGWNCVGNPYPSAINMNNAASAVNNFLKTNALDAVNIDPSYCVYVWNDGSKTYQVLNNVPGNPRDPGINVFSPGQGFFVKANGAGTIQFTTAMQVHNTSAVLKSTDIPWTSVALKATSTSTSSTAQVYFHEGMSKGLDPTYDAGLLRGSNGLSLYTKLIDDNGVDFAIQCLPENGMENFVIPVGLDAKAGGEVKFNATCTGLPTGIRVILEDRTAKVYTDLSNGADYVVTLSANSSGTGRFYIHTSNLTTGTSDLLPSGLFRLKAYPADGVIWIDGHVSSKAVTGLYDARGSQIGRYNLEEGNRNSIPTSGLTSGVYILKVIDGNNTFATKLVLVSNL